MVNYAAFAPRPIQPVDVTQFVKGREDRARSDELNHSAKLRAFIGENGPALANADPGAVSGLARFDPAAAQGLTAGRADMEAQSRETQLAQTKAFGQALMNIQDGDADAYNRLESLAVNSGMITQEQAAQWDVSRLPDLRALTMDFDQRMDIRKMGLDEAKFAQDVEEWSAKLTEPSKPVDEYGRYKAEQLANGQIPLGRVEYANAKAGRGAAGGTASGPTTTAADAPVAPTVPTEGVDYGLALGGTGAALGVVNTLGDLSGFGQPAPETDRAATALNSLATMSVQLLQDAVPGRPSVYTQQQLEQMVARPGSLRVGDARSLNRLQDLRDIATDAVRQNKQNLESGILTKAHASAAAQRIPQLEALIANYDAVIGSLEGPEVTTGVTADGQQIEVGPDEEVFDNPETGESAVFRDGQWVVFK